MRFLVKKTILYFALWCSVVNLLEVSYPIVGMSPDIQDFLAPESFSGCDHEKTDIFLQDYFLLVEETQTTGCL